MYIPETFAPENSQPENFQPQTNNNAELQTIKNGQKQAYFLPVLICQQNHQYCLLCNQNLHLDSFCKDEYLNNDNINSRFNIIKEVIPEEKKIILDSINNYTLYKPTKGCCSCPCVGLTTLFIFLLLLWTIASIILFTLGLGLLFAAYALRIVCCLYHCCIHTCCTTSVTEEDKGDHILRTTTIDVGK